MVVLKERPGLQFFSLKECVLLDLLLIAVAAEIAIARKHSKTCFFGLAMFSYVRAIGVFADQPELNLFLQVSLVLDGIYIISIYVRL